MAFNLTVLMGTDASNMAQPLPDISHGLTLLIFVFSELWHRPFVMAPVEQQSTGCHSRSESPGNAALSTRNLFKKREKSTETRKKKLESKEGKKSFFQEKVTFLRMCWEQDEQKIEEENFKFVEGGACQILALHPAVQGSILGVTKTVSLDVAEIYWWHCLELWTEAW